MEETELEEGEALCYNGVDEDSTIDPDVALSYIGEKLQDVLGHFQKDFEGGVSAENLGAKFGGYGSFLPTYQRSPSRSHANTATDIHKSSTPNSAQRFHLEDQRQSSSASRSVTPTARLDASGKTMLMGNSLKVDVDLPFRQVNESSLNRGVTKKSVNASDQRILKVRIKVGSDKVSTQKNADIYNGLGLVVSPSSLLDESQATSKQPSRILLDLQEGSPISILQTMTSFYGGLLLSPLSEDLIHLMEKRKLGVIGESELDKMGTKKSGMLVNGSLSSRSDQNVAERKKWKPSERDSSFTESKYHKSSSNKNNSVSALKKENETDIDTVECDELVSSALELPLLSNSQYTSDLVIGMNGDLTSSGMAGKKCLDTEPAQDICRAEKLTECLGLSTGLSESEKGKFDSSITACSLHNVRKAEKAHASGEYESNESKGTKGYSAEPIDPLKQFPVQKEGSDSEKGSKSALEKSSSEARRKLISVPSISSKDAYMSKNKLKVDFSLTSKRRKSSHPDSDSLVSKNDSHDLRKEKHGDLGFENVDESISGEMSSTGKMKDRQRMGRISENDFHDGLKYNCNKVNSENPHSLEVYSMLASHGIPRPGNGPSSEAPSGMAAPLNEDWVSCDKCGKWRLLQLGTNPKSLPNKWLCRMLTWLPGMNRCSVPEEETSNAIRAQALYHPSASVQRNQINNSLGTSVTVPSVQRHNDNKQESLANCSDTVMNSKTKSKRESDLDGSRASKRLKENEQFDYEKEIFDHGGASIKAGGSISSLKPEIHAPSTSDYCLLHSSIHDNKDSVRKRKGEEHHGSQSSLKPLSFSGHCQQSSGEFVDETCESDLMKEKKARVSNSRNQSNGCFLSNSQAEIYLKGDRSLVRSSVTANSSSSKISGSRKHKACAQEVKGSPVESVSSYPLRFYNADKATSTRKNLIEKDDFQDSHSLAGMSPKRFSAGEDDRGNDQTGMVKKDAVLCDIPLGQDNHSAAEKYSFEQCQIEGKSNAGLAHGNASHSKKREQGLASHKDKTRTSRSDSDKEKIEASDSSRDYLYHGHDEEKYKSRRNKFDDESSPAGNDEKFVCKKDTAGGTLSESSKGRGQIKYEGRDGQEVTIKRYNLLQEHDDKKLLKKSDQVEVNGNVNSLSLPPLARIQTETVASLQPVFGSEKEEKSAFGNGDALKASRQSMKPENQNVQPSSSRNPKLHKARDAEVPSPVRRDSNSQAANNALKEAKDLKHLADRLKHSGSGESNGLYFEASLKFLHAASLLESESTEGSKHNDVHSMNIYSSTAKLCLFCAHEYEKSKDMATAALAYKCTEVAYMRVVYSSHSRASRDRNDLQTSLHIFPPGDSPSSSASDVDNLNHVSTDNSAGLTKVGEPGSHVITSQNHSGFLRLLNFARDITFALEASRKSRNAYDAASSKLGETLHKDGITSLKKALDFNFQDVQGLLRLVRVSMEAINS